MPEYVVPHHSVAEYVHQKNSECAEAQQRLKEFNVEHLRDVLYDTNESTAVRGTALCQLIGQVNRSSPKRGEMLAALLEPLVDDPDSDISALAITYCPLIDEALISKVRNLADSGHGRIQTEAVLALAKNRDDDVLGRIVEWFQGEDEGYRNLSIEGLITFDTAPARQLLEQSYASGGRSENDRAVLAVALLRLGDTRGIELLKEVARCGKDSFSVMAATQIYFHSSIDGLQLMRYILDNGQLEVKQSMVGQISSLANLPHAYTADGIHEARFWIDQQLKSEAKQ